ncbi:MAG TPA: alpha/beta hydrolase [Steroidobacteraceae bacterium]|nr:alpha/beta hydrolase [Steroidobacteraceae bacterium]
MNDRSHSRVELVAAFLLGGLLCPDFALAAGLSLAPCRISDPHGLVSVEARCGKLSVPEDPDEPQGAAIQLAVAVVPAIATRAKPDPLFLLAGGPGQGAIEGYAPLLGAFAGVRRERDLVLVDQRGTGGSNRLDCEMPEEAFASGEIPPATLREMARACLAGLDARPQFYTTSIAVRDLEAVRAALGYERINVFGASYGTRVAQHYARRHPERTRTVALDSVIPPDLVLIPRIALESQTALDGTFARCQADAACNARFPQVAAQFRLLDERLRRVAPVIPFADPVSGDGGELEVTRAHLLTMARMLTYSARTASLLPLVVHEAASRGNYAPLAAQAEMIGEDLERMIAMGMHHSVVCAEDAPRFDGAVDRAELARTYMGPTMLDAMTAICEVWPRGPADPDFSEPLDSRVPALLFSGEFDPATPAAYGSTAAAGFRNGLHLVVPGQGHGTTRLPCVQRLLRQFIDRGSPAGLDTSCVDEIRPAPFFLSFSGPAP